MSDDIISLARVDYKQAKELFVINVTGCSFGDIMSTLLISPLLCIIYQEISSLLFKSRWYNLCFRWILCVIHFILELFIFVIPIFLVCTIWQERKWTYCVLITVCLCLHFINKLFPENEQTEKNSSRILTIGSIDSKYKGYLTAFRSIIVLFTCVCILAVDFQIFPRKYAKTYLTGYSLMDIGVGLYIVSSGIVAPMKSKSLSQLAQEELILFFLGIFRWCFLHYTSYIQTPLEYGRDWNFFFTLCIIHITGYVLLHFIHHPLYLLLTGCCLAFYYQFLLSFGLSMFIRENHESTFIAMNANGLFSCFGFLSLFILATAVGMTLKKQDLSYRGWYLVIMTIIMAIFFGITNWIEPASRRLANSSYVFLVMLIAMIILTISYCINWFYGNFSIPILFKQINHHQLIIFIIANLFTGIINLYMKTMLVDKTTSIQILISYLILLSIISCIIPNRHFFVCFTFHSFFFYIVYSFQKYN